MFLRPSRLPYTFGLFLQWITSSMSSTDNLKLFNNTSSRLNTGTTKSPGAIFRHPATFAHKRVTLWPPQHHSYITSQSAQLPACQPAAQLPNCQPETDSGRPQQESSGAWEWNYTDRCPPNEFSLKNCKRPFWWRTRSKKLPHIKKAPLKPIFKNIIRSNFGKIELKGPLYKT